MEGIIRKIEKLENFSLEMPRESSRESSRKKFWTNLEQMNRIFDEYSFPTLMRSFQLDIGLPNLNLCQFPIFLSIPSYIIDVGKSNIKLESL